MKTKTETDKKAIISTNGNVNTTGKTNGYKSNGVLKKSVWEYSKSIEDSKHIKLKSEYDLYIGGKWVKSKKYFETINPSNEEVIAKVAYASNDDVNKAVNAAEKAYNTVWSKTSGKDRGKYLFRVARILQEKAREFAVIESMDGGKPIRESKSVDIPLSLAHFFYYAGWADKIDYAFPNRKVSSIGVAGQIIPWNFPLLMAAWKIAPALACGNTVVIKSAETTPLTLYKLAEVFEEAGLPEGVVNIISGDGDTGAAIVNHPKTKKIAFTGSTEVGKLIMKQTAGTDKKITLELGGKAANIIFEDAPIDAAIEGIINGIYFNQGHVCCAGSRLLVQESIKDIVIKKLKHRLKSLRVGDPLDKNTDVGAINSKMQLNRIREMVQYGIDEGATMYQSECSLPDRGYWFRPTFFSDVAQSHRIANEEIFGPVLSILTFRTPAEAIEKANNTFYGLSAGVWTDKGSKIFKTLSKLRAGIVWSNTFNKFNPASPFGGYKESGFGREGGRHGLSAYLK
ncbi:MAG: aldehyde dehydrogenase family protein [Ignavibacteria bacterium]|nr:aldehyde dehydrogenase family protein [Ignavibacteria bacterium]